MKQVRKGLRVSERWERARDMKERNEKDECE